MQKQLRRLQEDVMMRWKDEKSVVEVEPPLQDADKPPSPPPQGDVVSLQGGNGLNSKMLAAELERLKESERGMLECLTSQTKQLEQSKIQLEEAKLEIRILKESSVKGDGDAGGGAQDEMARLRNEAKLAMEAEEKSREAMDDLAAALKEMATEEKDAKEKLKALETQYLSARAEADHTMSMLKSSEERIQSALERVRRTEAEADEAAASWRTKEERFVECIKSLEEEITSLKNSTEKESNSREQVSKQLRDIMKQAMNEATVVKQSLEIARNENSRLQETIVEKEEALQKLKHELGCVKVSEASAQSSVDELRNLLAADSFGMEASRYYWPGSGINVTATAAESHQQVVEEITTSERRRLLGCGSFRMPSAADDQPRLSKEPAKHRRFASMGCLSIGEKASRFSEDNSCDDIGFDGGSFRSQIRSPGGSPTGQRKKKMKKKKRRNSKPILSKFGDMLRSFSK